MLLAGALPSGSAAKPGQLQCYEIVEDAPSMHNPGRKPLVCIPARGPWSTCICFHCFNRAVLLPTRESFSLQL